MSKLYKSDTASAGIWRGLFVSVDESNRSCQVYIPMLHRGLNPFKSSDPKEGVVSNLSNYPTAQFSCPGVFVTPEVGDTCWVMFEQGDMNFPVVVGQIGTTLPEGDVTTAIYGGGGGAAGGAAGGYGAEGYLTGCYICQIDSATIDWVATCVTGEGGSNDLYCCRLYASHAANLCEEKCGENYTQADVMNVVNIKNHTPKGWYASASWTRGCSEEAKQAVREVFLEGKRWFPRFVTEFDTFPSDIVNPKNREDYRIGDTVTNRWGSTYAFYRFMPSADKDIAGYFPDGKMYQKYKDDVDKMNQNASAAAGGVVGGAIAWAVKMADTPVSQGGARYVWGAHSGQDYDCSGFVWAAFHDGGGLTSLNYASTGEMENEYTRNGFVKVTNGINFDTGSGLQAGDILVNPSSHTELMISATRKAGAHTAANALEDQVTTSNYKNYGSGGYQFVLRYGGNK